MSRPNVVSFWVIRDAEHPEAAARNYPGMLSILQRSCERAGLRHLVLTDFETAGSPLWPDGVASFAMDLPLPLMQAFTEAQARFLEAGPLDDTLLVGADCIIVGDVARFPEEPGLCVTYRDAQARYPINSGAIFVRRHSLPAAAALFRRIADRCGTIWCDDQRALRAELEPMPPAHGVYPRGDLSVAFLPMHPFNSLPRSALDPRRDAVMLHFRGKGRKQLLFDWARLHGYAA